MDRPLTVPELQRLAAIVATLPAGPWQAVERTDMQVHGPAAWDPDEQPSEAAHARSEQRRSEQAAWRGVVAADGTLIVGEPLPGGSPRPVVDPAWRWVADSPAWASRLLATVRELWRDAHATPPPPPPASATPPRTGAALEVTGPTVEVAAKAAYESVHAAVAWQDLGWVAQQDWRRRAASALAAAATFRASGQGG